jgi:hypothetical protein
MFGRNEMSRTKRVIATAVLIAAASVGFAGVANASDYTSDASAAGINVGGLLGGVLNLVDTLL